MKIAVEVQPVLENALTGVGWYTEQMVRRLKQYAEPEDHLVLLGMDFYGHSNRLAPALSSQVDVKTRGLLPYGVYRRLWHFAPFMDYGRYFGVKADLYHFTNFVVPPYVQGKVLVTLYDMVCTRFPETMEKANRQKLERNLHRSARRADRIITISENSRREISQDLGIPPDKIRILCPGVDASVYYPVKDPKRMTALAAKYKLPPKYFLYLGTLEPRKNIPTLLTAHRIFCDRHPDGPALVIAGKKGWRYHDIFETVCGLDLTDRVVFTGYVDEGDKPALYSGACAFLFPSFYEGFGMPPLEAMACGIPVIAANSSSLPEVVGDGGYLVDPLDAEAIALHMEALYQDSALAQRLKRRALNRAKLFSWERSAEGLMGLYKELMQ